AGPARLIDSVDLPAAIHLQMRMNAGLTDADEQVLAAAEHLVDDLAGEINGGEFRYPDVASCQRLPGEGIAQDGCGVPDGVALRHRLPASTSAKAPTAVRHSGDRVRRARHRPGR